MLCRYEETKNDVPAVVLGSHKIGLGIIRALGQMGIPVVCAYYNDMDMGYVSKYVRQSFKTADPTDDEGLFLQDLVKIAELYKGSVLFASDDATLLAVSKNKDALKELFIIESPDWETIRKVLNKQFVYRISEELGVLSPKTYLPKDYDEAVKQSENLDYPYLFKPTVGHLFFNTFKKKMLFINNTRDLEDAYSKMGDFNTQMMLQEFIPGDDTCGVNYNSFFINQQAVVEFTAEKVRLTPPHIGFPRVVISKLIPEVLEPGRKLLSALDYQGFSCMEFKRDARSGNYVLMEINGRQNLSTPLAVKCGINFPYIAYRQLIDGSLPEIGGEFEEGIYWIDTGKDIIESFRSFREERFSPAAYLRPYLNSNVQTLSDLNDMRPLFKRFCDGARVIKHKICG